MRGARRANDIVGQTSVRTLLWTLAWVCAWMCGLPPGAQLSASHAQQALTTAPGEEDRDASKAAEGHHTHDEEDVSLKRDLARLELLQEHLDALQAHAALRQSVLGWSLTTLGVTGTVVTGAVALGCAGSTSEDRRCGKGTGLIIAGGASLLTGAAGALVLTMPTDALSVADEFALLRVDSKVAITERVERGESMLWALSERGRLQRLTLGGTFLGLAALGAGGAVANRLMDSDAAVQTALSAGLTGAIGFGAFGIWMLTRRSRYERLWDRYYREASAVAAREFDEDESPHRVEWALFPWLGASQTGAATLGGALMMVY